MNIKGYEKLIEMKFPVSRSTFLFRTLEEIPAGHIDVYGDEPRWFMAGFDYENTRITDPPQIHRQVRALSFSREQLEEKFGELEGQLTQKQVPPQNRKYLIWEMHTPDITAFSGFGFKGPYDVMIDFFNGVRSSRRESDPCFSIQVSLVGEHECKTSGKDSYLDYAARIVKDLMRLPDNMSVDFVQLKDGYLFYHDLWQIA